MTRDEFSSCVSEILESVGDEHHARVTEILSNISADYESFDSTRTENETLTKRNNELKKVNGTLLIQVGQSNVSRETVKNESTNQSTSEAPKITIESLFNEKGELK